MHWKYLQGSVISCPKDEHAIIPVQINCQRKVPYNEMIPDDIKHLKLLWRNALQVVEHGKTLNPNIPKYHKNFLVMIQEVLKQHVHLFMENEKLFLGAIFLHFIVKIDHILISFSY